MWWGGDAGSAVTISLTTALCPGDTEARTLESAVQLDLKAQQRACGSLRQFNAGRSADDCEHSLVLTVVMDDQGAMVPGGEEVGGRWSGCTLSTHPTSPVVFEARTWHEPESDKLLGTLLLGVSVQL